MKIFITGATGFIGKHLVKKLLAEGHELTVNLRVNKLSPFESNVHTYTLGKESITDDICFLKENTFDGIIHLASLYLTVHKPEEAVQITNSNVSFSTYILECASQANTKWFLNTGTFWQNYQNKDYSPVNLYAASKQAFESIARYYVDTNKIQFATLRLSDTFGPNDTRPKIFNLWKRISKTGETLDMSPGEQIIDISYIDDIVAAFVLLVTHLQNNSSEVKNGDVFAVKAEKRYTLKELAKVYEHSTGFTLNINWGVLSYREREVVVPWKDGTVVPGWKPSFTVSNGIELLLKSKKE